MAVEKVIPLHPSPLTHEEALSWLRQQPDGRVTATAADLGRQWGWPRQRVSRQVKGWARDKLVRRRGRVLVAVAPDSSTPLGGVTGDAAKPVSKRVTRGATNLPQPHAEPPKSRFLVVRGAALVVGIALAAIGLWINARYQYEFGRTDDARWTLGSLGLATDGATLVLPAIIGALWVRGRFVGVALALSLYAAAVTQTMLNAAGYVSTHVGDAVAGRHATLASAAAATDQRAAAIRVAQVGADAARTAREGECGNGRGDKCRAREGDERLALAALSSAIAAPVPKPATIATADPQVEGARRVIAFASAGIWDPTAGAIEMLRLLGMTLVPIMGGGLLIGFAVSLR